MSARVMFYGDELVERIEIWRCWRALAGRPAVRIALTHQQIESLRSTNAITLQKAGVDQYGAPTWSMFIGTMQVVEQEVDQFAGVGTSL